MDLSTFNDHVASLTVKILEKPNELSAESCRYWTEILSEQLKFKRRKKSCTIKIDVLYCFIYLYTCTVCLISFFFFFAYSHLFCNGV